MLDAVALFSLVLLFSLSVLYTAGCDRLKGDRP